jgi:uncharacterized membrane protein YfcA
LNSIPVPFIIATIAFISTVCQATFGFGAAMIAMPVMAFFIALPTATPFVAAMCLITSAAIVGKDWKQIDWRSTWQLLLASVFGMPIGLWLLIQAPESRVKIILGIFLALFGLYSLLPTHLPELKSPYLAIPFGFFAGIFGSAYNINAPPVILYGAVKNWEPKRYRASLSGFFLPAGVMIIISHISAGLWTVSVASLLIASLPGIVLAIYIGNFLNKRLEAEKFRFLLNIFIVMMGLLLILTAL